MQGDDITVCSLNVRGLTNNQKRRKTFLWLEKKKKFSIYFLQEVHSTRETEICWQSEWGYSNIFTNFSSSRAGVGILFNNNFYFQILKYFVDPEGRFIIADIKIQDKTLTLVSIYAPNKDEPTFFKLSSEFDYIFFPENIDAKLTDDQRLSCEGELSAAECFESLETMEMGRSPGTDGLLAEFYKVSWNDVSTYLLASLNSSPSKGHLSISQRRGLITLIPK